jgi:hypothetical protein
MQPADHWPGGNVFKRQGSESSEGKESFGTFTFRTCMKPTFFFGPIWTETQVGNLSSRDESINLSIYHQSMNPSMYQSIHLSIYLSVNHLIYPMIYLSMCRSIYCIHVYIYLPYSYPILSCSIVSFYPILPYSILSCLVLYIHISIYIYISLSLSLPPSLSVSTLLSTLFIYPFLYLVYKCTNLLIF